MDWKYACEDSFDILRMEFFDGIKELKFYLKTMEEFVTSAENHETKKLKKKLDHLTTEQRELYFERHHNPIDWDALFRKQLRTSFITLAISMIEFHLKLICQHVRVIRLPKNIKIKRNHIKGSFLESSKLWLESFGDFSKPDQDKWDLLKQIYSLRNCLVHNNGDIEEASKKEEIIKLIKKNKGVYVDSIFFISIDKEFGEFLINTVSEFLETMYDQYKELCEKKAKFVESAKKNL